VEDESIEGVMNRSEVLRGVPMFATLPGDVLQGIGRRFVETTYQPGEYVFFEGDPAQRLYVVAAGEVKLVKHSESGHDVILQVFTPGQVFGGIAFLVGATYPASAQAQTVATALSISSEIFREIVHRHPDIALAVVRVLGTRLMQTQEQVRQLVTERVEQRLARLLLRLADQVGEPVDDGVRLGMRITRQDLADMTGTTLETVSRTISKWRRQGIVQAGREEIVITWPHGLVLIAEDLEDKPPD
jgi:CRP-like cAMP-binding protein